VKKAKRKKVAKDLEVMKKKPIFAALKYVMTLCMHIILNKFGSKSKL
jgi:hypothetical protein